MSRDGFDRVWVVLNDLAKLAVIFGIFALIWSVGS
jgi:hypothetical protein